MSYKLFATVLAFALAAPAPGAGQLSDVAAVQTRDAASSLAPGTTAAALLPDPGDFRGPDRQTPGGIPVRPRSDDGRGPDFLTEVVVLGAASFGGFWAGRQPPFPPADDDSDLSVLHLVTMPLGSAVSVALASVLLGNGVGSSMLASALGMLAGAGAGVLARSGTDDTGATLTYAAVHGFVAALKAR